MLKNLKIKLLLFVLFAANYAMAQNDGLEVDLFTLKDGLSQTNITAVFQDSRGYLWIGTPDGLNRYNGYGFDVFQHVPSDSSTLPNNFINGICEDNLGDLWLATNHGLSRFSRRDERFYNYFMDVNKPDKSLMDDAVYSVFVDSEGYIWVKTNEHFSRLDPTTEEFVHHGHDYDFITFYDEGSKAPILEDLEGNLWIGTKDRLLYYDRQTGVTQNFVHDENDPKSISHNKINALYQDKDGAIWIGTEVGLNKYNPQENSFIKYFKNNNNSSKGPLSNRINALYQDASGKLWIGTGAGISYYLQNENRFYNFSEFYYDYNLITSVTSIIEDHSQILWIGTLQGLVKYDQKKKKFTLYKKSSSSLPDLSSNSISALYVDYMDRIWVGTNNFGLNIVNRRTKKVINYTSFPENPNHKISNDVISTIFQDSKGAIWVGTNSGIDLYDWSSGRFYSFVETHPNVVPGYFTNNRINCMFEDKDKNIWMGSKRGLFRYNLKDNDFEKYNLFENDSLRIDLGNITSIVQDENGYLWIGTERGIIQYHHHRQEFYKHERSSSDELNNLSSDKINVLYYDSKNYLWIGTPSGLNKYDIDNKDYRLYTELNGLPNNIIYGIVEDSRGELWLSTNKGICNLDPTVDRMRNFDISDGLQGFEYHRGVSHVSRKGEIFFGGISGFNSFVPDSIKYNRNKPPIVFNSLMMITDGDQIERPLSGSERIEIPPNVSVFNIYFSALDYTWPDKNQYAYKLYETGSEGKWIEIGNQHNVSFSNVSPGEYILQIRGTNNDNVRNDEGTYIRLVIETPFWKSDTAIVIYVLFVLMLFYAFYFLRTRSLRETNKILKDKEQAAIQIKLQKEELTIQNKAITDSINYARRIQNALMPSDNIFDKLLPEHFVYYKPKDIVSGDFYWITETDKKIFIAAADCTGHGVPGAFMSIIGFELFRNITLFKGIEKPGEILSVLNSDFAEIFGTHVDVTLRDGMDVAFLAFDKQKNLVEYAGAHNPLYIARENKIMEIKSDRFSIGQDEYDLAEKKFKNHELELKQDDVLYIFSDGYVDQFGGAEGKKYKYRRFRHLLMTIHKLPMLEQLDYLDQSMKAWRGNHEQVDDILVIGIKPQFKK